MNPRISIVGLGYVGLPLAIEFAKHFKTTGFDINNQRLNELRAGHDRTLEVAPAALKASVNLSFSSRIEDIKGCDFFIVTVPTPIDGYNRPDLTPLIKASETVGKALKRAPSWCTRARSIRAARRRIACRSSRSSAG